MVPHHERLPFGRPIVPLRDTDPTMIPLIIAMQVAPAQPVPPGSPPPYLPPPAPAQTAPAQPPGTPPPAQPTPGQPGMAPQPPQPMPGQPTMAPPPAQPQPPPPVQEQEVTFFGRVEIGFGTRGFAENNTLLDEVGYGGFRFWATLDGAYMFHRHVGVGPWLGMNRRSSRPEHDERSLNEVAYFVGAQVPVLLFGKRPYAFHATPRLAFTSAQIEIDNAADAEFQNTAMFGGAVSFTSFTYHVSSSMAFMHAPTGPPGELGRDHDYAGLYFTLGGTIDG